ncbi:acetyltransferase [Sinorhizobium mexicanum]|uniref:Acetyltransferase n=1 Tax=Sinorhizobium mexicanum TaxID=375549 RepID=A0A859R8A1_9HYPH|nr:acetyltransferase [Sinorhizobium mexicanum]MBP1888129.1 sugar O-acyltransferase (sialic acid O-acetyltransferase NeuD family) [Sinorhizobium mexicanum]QLL65668.1 acetyltransferase [Sinorhizobium mexicanum]
MSEGRSLILLGAGGHAKVVAEVARASHWQVAGYLDPALMRGEIVAGAPVLGGVSDLFDGAAWLREYAVFPATGRTDIRWREFQRLLELEATVPTLVHPRAIVSSSAVIDTGTVVMAGAVIQADARVGACSIINTGALVDHDCVIGSGVMIAPGAVLLGGAKIGNNSFIAAGAIVVPGAMVGSGAFVGAGTVVAGDVPDGARITSARSRISAERQGEVDV